MKWILVHVPPVSLSRPVFTLPFSEEVAFFINSSRSRRWFLLILETQFPILFIFTFCSIQWISGRKIKWTIQCSLMKKIFCCFIKMKKIMSDMIHLIQAGWMRHHLHYSTMLQKQHRPYDEDKK